MHEGQIHMHRNTYTISQRNEYVIALLIVSLGKGVILYFDNAL